jgi:SAM-dependent methyltransferase
MRCVRCGGRLELADAALRCSCGEQYPIVGDVPVLLDVRDRARQDSAGHMEALFRFPSFYWLKMQLLLLLNKTDDLTLTDYLRHKHVLDVGCGPFIYGYDATLPSSIVGLDLSPQFVRAISRHDPSNFYLVGNARAIPFADKSFDVSFLRYVIHHIPGDTATLLSEVARVTREYLIIFDHVRSDVPWQRAVQLTYWTSFDSGHHYNSMREWDGLLRPYRVAAFRRTGRMFGNVCQAILDLRGHA